MKLRCPECKESCLFSTRVTIYATWLMDEDGELVSEEEESRSVVIPNEFSEFQCEQCGYTFVPADIEED